MNSNRYIYSLIRVIALLFVFASCTRVADKEELSIQFEKYVLPNGLQVVLHTDYSDPLISYAIVYHVGSSREVPGKTGFAHLFEHLLFGGSENVPPGLFDKIIEGVGGASNGFTSRDVTTYFESFPKNALEKVLWLESDRMGFFINSVSQRLLAIQQNVVQNEKRQSVDNSPYGFTTDVICKNLYPAGHPYNWDVIGEMEDLKNATLDDVKNFYDQFYGPNNATLVLAGDFNVDSAKLLIEKYFGELQSHGEVSARESMVPSLANTVKLYHEDHFANVPEINLVWPVPEQYHKDAYALDFLASILADGKKAPLYKVLVKEKQLTSRTTAYNSSSELAGEFTISIRANEEKNLKEIEEAVAEAFQRFETEGITEKDVERVKASFEKSFYRRIGSVLYKSFQLAFYNTFKNDPGFIEKDIENIKAVTLEDVKRVYREYIRDKAHVVTSFVPKGKPELMADNSDLARVTEEDITRATQVEIAGEGTEETVKTPSAIDRTMEPLLGKDPEVTLPQIWRATLANGILVLGIQHTEVPLVSMELVIDGGASQDLIELPGVANMVANVLPQGTITKTPEELEEEIELLGSDIFMRADREEISMVVSALSRNFKKTVQLMKEILLEPRWDSVEFALARTRTFNYILQSEAQPQSVAMNEFNRLLYGKDHIFGYNIRGTKESISKVTLDDLKNYYNRNFSPSLTRIHVAGNVSKEQVLEALKPLEKEWQAKEVVLNSYSVPAGPEKSQIYFYDIPGSRQSVITIGYLAISRSHPDYIKTDFINYRLGGAFTSILNQILREQKGFTYGAHTYFIEQKAPAPFMATSMVRSDATLESMKIFKTEMEKYRNGISQNELQFVQDYMIKSNALRFETLESLTGMLSTMSKYGFADDYIKQEESIIKGITVEEHKAIAEKYIVPDRMYYLVVGDAATQLKPLETLGMGKPVLLN